MDSRSFPQENCFPAPPVTEKTKNNRIKHDNNLISGTSHSSHQRFITCAAGFPSIVNPLSPAGSSWNCGR